uniref:SFRICE_022295 n=1 Tax=Spodoptera frugiperda TaxID=7108 RepID=A0A2H1VJW0_SPOFR
MQDRLYTPRISNASGDACERRDPCQHGGVCISTDDGPICECRDGDYEGAFCERVEMSALTVTERVNERGLNAVLAREHPNI